VLRVRPPAIKLLQSSQIVVRRLFDHDEGYRLQQPDGRLVHLVPLEGNVMLIGSVGRPFAGDPAHAAVSAQDAVYLTRAVNRYFREQLQSSDVVRSVAGIHVLDAGRGRSAARDHGVVRLQRSFGEAPLLTTFGGETTTARRQAEDGMAALAPFFAMPGPWTAQAPLPGGDVAGGAIGSLVDSVRARWPFLPAATSRRLVNAYGTLSEQVLDGASNPDDLGPDFGDGLSGREVNYLMAREWARFADDVLWRRSCLGLTMTAGHRDALARFMTTQAPPGASPLQ